MGQDRTVNALEKLLLSIDRPGDFCAHGRLFAPMPRLDVEGAGALSFPVPEAQVRALIAGAERAPYGKGSETLLDRSVRDCWQIDPERMRLAGAAWPETFAKILDSAAAGLGCPADRLDAQLYKLLIYEPGGFFSAHRDTEKAGGMVATLSISLPTAGAGGELIVRHRDREITIDMTAGEPSELAFAAFYADCAHEIRPVIEGHRLSLVFNLCLRAGDTDTPRAAPDYTSRVDLIARRLAEWGRAEEGADKLVWLLDHQYSEAGLSFGALKNTDAALARILALAADRAVRFLREVLLSRYDGSENEVLVVVLGMIGPQAARGFLLDLIAAHLRRRPTDTLALLRLLDEARGESAGAAWDDAQRDAVRAALLALPAALPPEPETDALPPSSPRPVRFGDEAVHSLFVLAGLRGLTDEAVAAAAAVAAQPRIVAPDRTLPAALGKLYAEAGAAGSSAFLLLWCHAADFLLARSAGPPAEPRDWAIAADVGCRCEHCERLRAFCKDPVARTARFPLRKDLRAHLHQNIDRHRLDIKHVTERRGRPFTLVCTKTRASHQRRLAEYAEDVSCMRGLIRSAPDGQQAARCAADLARLREAVAASERG